MVEQPLCKRSAAGSSPAMGSIRYVMPDISTLAIDVDPSQVTATTEALDRLTEAAERASAALDKLRGYEVHVWCMSTGLAIWKR